MGLNVDVFQGCIDSTVDIDVEVRNAPLQWSGGGAFRAVKYCEPTGYAVAAQFMPVWFYSEMYNTVLATLFTLLHRNSVVLPMGSLDCGLCAQTLMSSHKKKQP